MSLDAVITQVIGVDRVITEGMVADRAVEEIAVVRRKNEVFLDPDVRGHVLQVHTDPEGIARAGTPADSREQAHG